MKTSMASLPGLVLLAVVACLNPGSEPQATIRFTIDAPFCGLALPAQFFVDGALVGTDTFRIHMTPEHLTTRAFPTTPGTHTLGAKVTIGPAPTPWPDTPDTAVVFSGDEAFTRILPFYCS